MLVLTRRTGSTFTIGDNITVQVLSIDKNQVKIGVDAPPEIGIHRDDIKDKK